MLETVVAEVLHKVLGAFVKGIDAESLNLKVWAGEIRLAGLELKVEALETFELPVRVTCGTLGEVHVKVPWRSLGKEPMVVSLDRLFLVVAPRNVSTWDEKLEAEATARTKREQLAAWESLQDKQAGTQACKRSACSQ